MLPYTEMYFLYIIHLIHINKGYILYVKVLFKAKTM